MKDLQFSMETLKNGALQERFNDAITDVIRNAMDKNTDHKKARKVVISISMLPTEDRETMITKLDVKTTLAPPKVLETAIAIGFDGESYVAAEIGTQLVGQKFIDTESGEIKEVGNKLVDMQKRAQGAR